MPHSGKFVLLFFVAICTSVSADESAKEKAQPAARWDDAFFGITLEKPSLGRFWIVADTVSFSGGDKLQAGDKIMELDGKLVTVDDDLPAVLLGAND